MSTSGQLNGNNVDGTEGSYLAWQLASQDIPGNTSTINWQVGWRFSTTGCRGLRLGDGVINGTTVYSDHDSGDGVHGFVSGHNHRPALQTASGSIQIAHDSDGTKTFSCSVNMTGFSGLLSSGSTSFSLPDIVRAPSAPGTPTASRISDSQADSSWTNNSASHHEYASQNVYRSINLGAAALIATISGAANSYSDTTVAANQNIGYLIRAVNAAGIADSSWSNAVYTTPGAPSGLVATKLGSGNIRLDWTNNVAYGDNQYTTRIEESQDGGAFSELTSVSGGTATYEHVSPNPAVTHTYRVRARSITGSLNSSYSSNSNTIVLLSTANPPTGLSPAGVAKDATEDIVFTWTHNPTDSTPQSKRRVQYKVDAGSFTDAVNDSSSTSSYTLAGGTLSNGHTITWKVATAGENGTLSSFSAESSFTTSARPTVAITSLAGYTSSSLTADFTYFQAQSSAQATWRANLYDDADNLLESKSGTTEVAVTFSTALTDATTYKVQVFVTSAAGLESLVDEEVFTTDFLPPADVFVDAVYDTLSGTMVLTITGDGPVGGVTEAIATVDVQRQIDGGSWVTIITGLTLTDLGNGLTAVVIDTRPTIHGTNTYRAIAFSALPSSVTSAEEVNATTEANWSFLSANTGFQDIVRMRAMPTFGATASRGRALYHFAGRSKPVQLTGEATNLVLSIEGTLIDTSSTAEEFEALATTDGVVLWRDPTGRRVFGSLAEVETERTLSYFATVKFNVTEVDYDE